MWTKFQVFVVYAFVWSLRMVGLKEIDGKVEPNDDLKVIHNQFSSLRVNNKLLRENMNVAPQ